MEGHPFEPEHKVKNRVKFDYGESFIKPTKSNAEWNKIHADAQERAGKPRDSIGQKHIVGEELINTRTNTRFSLVKIFSEADIENINSEMRDVLRHFTSCSEVGHKLVPLRMADRERV